mmetsp:Transcript_28250/g.32059  ORF Transcript_28250/g.32059 Transcript_28250/m.32059 type:complete len:106 (-) Transcript_28250:162-479(-)
MFREYTQLSSPASSSSSSSSACCSMFLATLFDLFTIFFKDCAQAQPQDAGTSPSSGSSSVKVVPQKKKKKDYWNNTERRWSGYCSNRSSHLSYIPAKVQHNNRNR